MKKKKEKQNKIVKYPRQNHISIGLVMIFVMFIYIIYHLFTYITTENVTVYEVTQGAISSNLEYSALAIRDEEVVNADLNGNLLYLAENDSRVSVNTEIYVLDETGDIITDMASSSLSDENIDQTEYNRLKNSIYSFTLSYDNLDYNKIYTFKSELSSQIEQLYNISAMNAMEEQVNEAVNAGTFHVYKSSSSGLISYYIDGNEGLTLDTFTSENFDKSTVVSTNLKAQETAISGQAVYKIVNSDKWNLVCQIDEDLYNNLADTNYIEINFLEDDKQTWCTCTLEEKSGDYYLILGLDDSLDRYVNERFVNIKLLDTDFSGLKIPNSSIVTKEFYTVPKDYFYSEDQGILIKENDYTNHITPTIYYEDDDYYYIDNEYVNDDTVIIKPNSTDEYTIGTNKNNLEGVYNVNKGYAVFKIIDVLYQNEDYTIIRSGTEYGVSLYDHIVLQGNEVQENSIINL